MTTLEQAARQALETLERASDAGYSVECDETITALREALEQAAPKAAQAVVQDDLITIRKPTTSAEMLWLLKLAHLVISDVDKTLEETFAPAQPAAQQEALTDEQLAEMMRDTWGCASIAPRHALEFARTVERAHGIGIKGGQHGTE